MQRFGSYSVRTHTVGKEILNQNWKEVCRLILSSHVDYFPDSKPKKEAICRLVFDPAAEGDPHQMVENINEALDMLDRKDRLERCIL